MFENIMIAFLVVTGVGLAAGILLALASHFLHVKGAQKAQAILECLPGVNCGVCGYAGCADYAKAISLGEAKTNLCVPGADTAAARIAEIMGVEAEVVAETVAQLVPPKKAQLVELN